MSQRKAGMRTAITLPDHLLDEAEVVAKDLGMSRSKLIRTALEEFLKRRREAQIAAGFNEAIAKYGDPSDGEEGWVEQGRRIIAGMDRDEE